MEKRKGKEKKNAKKTGEPWPVRQDGTRTERALSVVVLFTSISTGGKTRLERDVAAATAKHDKWGMFCKVCARKEKAGFGKSAEAAGDILLLHYQLAAPLRRRRLGPWGLRERTSRSRGSSLSLSPWWTRTCLLCGQLALSVRVQHSLRSRSGGGALPGKQAIGTHLCRLSGRGYLCSLSGQNGQA